MKMPKMKGYSKQPIKTPNINPTPHKGQEINISEARKGSQDAHHDGTNS